MQNTVDKGAIFYPRYSIFDTLGGVPTANHHFSHSPGKTDTHKLVPASDRLWIRPITTPRRKLLLEAR